MGASVNVLDVKKRWRPVEKSKNNLSQNCRVLKPSEWTDRPVSLSLESLFFFSQLGSMVKFQGNDKNVHLQQSFVTGLQPPEREDWGVFWNESERR